MKKETKTWTEKFNDEQNYQLNGTDNNFTQSIDRDQAVDENGKALFKTYTLIDLETGEREVVSAEAMEQFAETW